MEKSPNDLWEAAQLALSAPSIFNTQPWRWVVHPTRLELRADRTRQLQVVDPDGRLLAVSCGVALHHALISLSGTTTALTLLPDDTDADLLATLALTGEAQPTPAPSPLREAIRHRHTDRRAFTGHPVAREVVANLVTACELQGAHLRVLSWHQIPILALAAVRAGALQLSEPAYRMELADWTHRPPWSGDGLPPQTVVAAVPRRVPVRDFAPFGGAELPAGVDNDSAALYGIVYTAEDTPRDWLVAGMGLSAVLLTATAAGLGTAPISDVTEEPDTRGLMRDLIPAGQPQVAVRIGHPPPDPPPSTPRRPANEVITGVSGDSREGGW
ncbi:MAG TPA: nitroreductase family protein [Candidatus Limnocylindrales bacterium]|nr:nitroreductase family protein [Candidatus Limnocylindrales bacterium]